MQKKEKAASERPNQLNEHFDLTVGYCRVSTFKQLDDGVSVEAQAERINHYAAARDMPAPKILTDARSGKSLDREQWEIAMKLIKAGRVRRLIVYKLDRLSRSLHDLIELAEALQAHNCELHVIAENVSTDSSSGRLFFHILGALAQWTRETIADNTRQALAYKRSRGEFTGGQTEFGYRTVQTGRVNRAGREILAIAPDQGEMQICNRILELRKAGHGVTRIWRALQAEGAHNRAGTAVTRKQIYRVIGRDATRKEATNHEQAQCAA